MKRLLSILLPSLIILILFNISSCSDDDKVTDPEEVQSSLSGEINYPFESSALSEMSLGFGQSEIEINDNGEFNLECNDNVSGMVILYDQSSVPILLSVVPNPKESSKSVIDIHSTALSLVFLDPFVCTSNPSEADKVVKKIESLPEFDILENMLEQKFEQNINIISTIDLELSQAVSNAVVAYINSVSPDINEPTIGLKKVDEEAVVITPSNIVSGHQIVHKDGDNFSISNWYGRWAKCILPNDSMYLTPNNDFLDFVKGAPWVESSQDFSMDIIPNDPPKEIKVYGLGKSSSEGNNWNDLTETEKDRVINAGAMTVIIEFVPRVLSLVTNFPFTFGNGSERVQSAGNLLRWFFQYSKNYEKAKLLVANGQYFTFCTEMTKEFIALLVTDDDFRELFIKEVGITLSEAAFKNLAIKVLLPLNVLYIADDITGLAKSTLGLYQAGFRTTFEIYSEEFSFGNVNGNVFDKEENTAIQGAIVKLIGDEGNPLNPNYVYTTDASGGFWFENIQEGEKSLQVSKSGYGAKTVDIEVIEEKTTEVTIELSKEKGSIVGKVLNEIFIINGITPTNFNKECHLTVTEIGGSNESSSFWIYEQYQGVYNLDLLPGTYEIKAYHEDYREAKVLVTIAGDETTEIPDLILKPKWIMEGTFKYDIDFDGSTEYTYSFNADTAGATIVITDDGGCPDNSNRSVINIIGYNNYETFAIIIDTQQVKTEDMYNLGGSDNTGCPGLNGKTSAMAITKRFQGNYYNSGNYFDLIFAYFDDSATDGCNCGIDYPGNIVITKYGNKLGDVIEGKILATMAGWKTGHCGCCNDDGSADVECSTLTADIEFKFIVGSINKGIVSQNPMMLLK
ncbi:MAG: carboxypeptidase-like regulatory domain-containing protein [Melioribacteraceae bacterium]|nr:carboxypeptidase-like regulatory domain-containing protein [Melioribacteraceae bacterium]